MIPPPNFHLPPHFDCWVPPPSNISAQVSRLPANANANAPTLPPIPTPSHYSQHPANANEHKPSEVSAAAPPPQHRRAER